MGETKLYVTMTFLYTETHSQFQNYSYVQIKNHKLDKSDTCALLGYYTACSGNSLPMFQDNLSVPSSRVKNPTSGRDVQLSPHTGVLFVISGFCCRVDKTVLFWDIMQHVVVIPSLALGDGTDRLSQNVGKDLPLHTV
jgi:hypothetical protein